MMGTLAWPTLIRDYRPRLNKEQQSSASCHAYGTELEELADVYLRVTERAARINGRTAYEARKEVQYPKTCCTITWIGDQAEDRHDLGAGKGAHESEEHKPRDCNGKQVRV